MENNDNYSNWFLEFKKTEEYKAFAKNPVAYFCAEYALDSSLPTYAGGLGILAGDYVREAAMRGFPLLSVGLRYQKAQSVLSSKKQEAKNKLKTVIDKNNQEIIVSVPIGKRIVKAKAWLWEEDEAKVFLLDTDITENDPKDREISKCLYDENRNNRLKQEILLGLGGFRLLALLGYHASVYHLNEGHSAFLTLELVRHEMKHQRVNFRDACEFAKKHIIFTNHTLVPAGQEVFSSDKISSFIELCAEEICLNNKDITTLGAWESDSNIFSMTTLSFKLSTKSNAVSKLHAEKSKKIWPNQIIDFITNGINVKKWDKIVDTSIKNIWERHLENKRKLLTLVKEEVGEIWNETDLIFVWARRLVEYKQPLLFLDNIEKIIEISRNSPVPIRIIFSGPTGGNESPLVATIKKIIEEKLKGIAIFVPNYSTEIAEILTAGADVWLNTPLVGFEACGTSGMKAGLNGVLSLSTRDGWVYEVTPDEVGWVVNDSQNGEEMRSVVERNIIPLYFDHLKNPKDSVWVKKMEKVRSLIIDNFSTSRVLKEYIEKLYIPTLKQKHIHKID